MKIYYIGCASDFFNFQDYLYTHELKNSDSVLFCFHEFCPSINICPEDIVVLGAEADYNMLKKAEVNNSNICTEQYVNDNLKDIIPDWNCRIRAWNKSSTISKPVDVIEELVAEEPVVEEPVIEEHTVIFQEESSNDPLRWVEWK